MRRYSMEREQLRWSAVAHGWIGKTDEVVIIVSEQMYEQHLKAYLESCGMELKTWVECMKSAEEEWRKQCEAVNALQADLDFWLSCKEPGLEIHPRSDKAKR
jgi:hypothetical protein